MLTCHGCNFRYFQVFPACWCALTNSWFVVDFCALLPPTFPPAASTLRVFSDFSTPPSVSHFIWVHTRNNFPYGRQFVCHAHINLWFWRYSFHIFFLWNLNSCYIVSDDDVDDEQRIPQGSITQLFIRWHLKRHQMPLDTWDFHHPNPDRVLSWLPSGKPSAKIEVICC